MTVLPVDLQGYVDLTLYDRNPGSLVERALNDAVAKLPGWIPREGLTEMVLIEGLALEVAELVYAINRLPGAVAEGVVRLFGVTRDQGAAPVMTVEFAFVDNTGRTVVAGTRLRLTVAGEAFLFTVDADATDVDLDGLATATATGARFSAAPNGTVAGTAVDMLDVHYYVDSAVVDVAPTGGRDAEGTAAWVSRATARLARLTDTLMLPDHFVAFAIENPAVRRAFVANQYNPAVGPAPGSNPGHVTLAVLGPDGVALSAGAKSDLFDDLRPLTADHLELHVVDATVTAVAVTVTVTRLDGFTVGDVQASVAAALQAYLDPNVWAWAGTVYRNELISVIDQAPGVGRVTVLTLPAADAALAGVAPLADAGAIIVNVV